MSSERERTLSECRLPKQGCIVTLAHSPDEENATFRPSASAPWLQYKTLWWSTSKSHTKLIVQATHSNISITMSIGRAASTHIVGKPIGPVGYGMMTLTVPFEPIEHAVAAEAMKTALNQGANLWNGVCSLLFEYVPYKRR
jgi:hypothetical protein